MPRPDGRLEPGQPLRHAISARAWNRAQDAADLVLGDSNGVSGDTGSPVLKPYAWCYGKPMSDVSRWNVVGITGFAITPTSESGGATASFEEMPVVTVDTPSESTTACGVAVEPISSGKIGRIAVGGVVQCKTADLGKTFGSTIIWKNSEWSLIRLNSGIVRAHFSGTWEKDSSKSVTAELLTGTTYTAHNYIATISSQTDCKCFIMHDGSEWVLVSWDLHKLPSYNAAKQQVLTHSADGGLAWVSTTNCS
jgi:hypothetical protein